MRYCALITALIGLALAGVTAPSENDRTPQDVAELVKQLGDDRFATRERASLALKKIGAPALSSLRKATSSNDAEVRRRAEQLVEAIESRLPLAFNRKDLTGWEGIAGCWAVRKGDLVGDTGPGINFNTCLCSRKKVKDFELWFQVRLGGTGWPGNSGVQIRSTLTDRNKFIVQGPQCDMGENYWGDLYGELSGGLIRKAPGWIKEYVRADAFTDYYVRCVGKHVTIQLNGMTTVDGEFAQLPDEGILAWQLHGGGPMTVVFRNIMLVELPRK
jgi:hypothetical protein